MIINKVLERNILPDPLIRFGIRNLLKKRIKQERSGDLEDRKKDFMKLVEELKNSPIAMETTAANKQHYEVPTEFFKLVLGKKMKYSSAYWNNDTDSLNEAEENMLQLTCERAQIINGADILEFGCGWGSLSLYMAEKFPDSKITAVSNSKTQKIYIDNIAAEKGFKNIKVITADVNYFDTDDKYDRVVSVEMFEHMRNYEMLMKKISNFLRPEGKLFVHIFTHKDLTYLFEVKDDTDWMAKYFFTAGIMPSDDLLLYFQVDFKIEEHWRVNGINYQKTAEAWLRNMDLNKTLIMQIFKQTYSEEEYRKWWVYWRVFFMSCAELWGYRNGEEWFVSHYLFRKR